MISRQEPATAVRENSIPPFLTPALWQHVIDTLGFSPQQARIVSLILQGMADKDILAEMGLSRGTLRTYLRRIFDRLGVDDRVGLVLRVFAFCAGRWQEAGCHTFV